jgi:CheY-like chemotaxis protein
LELSLTKFSFEDMLQKVMGVNNFLVEAKRQEFTSHVDPDIPPVLVGDELRLTQVITNLLSNAIKFTPEGGSIRLDARLEDERDGDCVIWIGVTDTGIGISEEQRARLFVSFQQAESSTSREFGGTGLGLAISKRLVELMDGQIGLESEPDVGSTFFFTVRLRRGDEGAPDARGDRGGQDAAAGASVGPSFGESPEQKTDDFSAYHVLLVEDVEINREIVLSFLEPTGVQVDIAENGEKAVEMVSGHPGRYELIFMDLQMPRMDGYEATRRIRALDAPGVKYIPIIAMTANVFREDVERCLACGMNDHMGKPLDREIVLSMLRAYLSRA